MTERVIPYWTDHIAPDIQNGKQVLIVAIGTSLRGILKYIENLGEEEITKLNLPTGIPFVFEIDRETMMPISSLRYLAEDSIVQQGIEKVLYMGLKH